MLHNNEFSSKKSEVILRKAATLTELFMVDAKTKLK